ncbi:MAG TPA: hypothetical protein VFC40_02020, partial [Syntrophomonas sp.]|nr:hypothetical protein [Syntrophomonas sp.]
MDENWALLPCNLLFCYNEKKKVWITDEQDGRDRYMSEVHPPAKPFFLAGSSGQALLLLHGFTASPSEIRPLAELINTINGCCL